MRLPYKICFVALHILALPLHFISISTLVLYKLLVCLVAKATQHFVGTIPGSNALFVADPIWTRPSGSIVFAVELNGRIGHDEAINIFQKVYDENDERGRRCFRELGYHFVHYLGHGFWKEVPNFKISDRIHILETDKTPGVTLTSLVEGIQRDGYEKEQPLWDIYLLSNYNDKSSQTLVIGRFHHLMADGMSLVKLFYALCGHNKLPAHFAKASSSMEKWDQVAGSIFVKLGTALNLATFGFVDYFYDVVLCQDKHALHRNNHNKLKLSGDWICPVGQKLNLQRLKRASKNLECSVVHVILAGISSAMESYFYKYHGSHGVPEGFHFATAFPVPNHPNMRLVNHWALGKIYAKFGIGGTMAQLAYFKKETKRAATSTLPMMSRFTFKYVCGLLPIWLVKVVVRVRATFTITLSNIVGPEENWTLGESTINDMFFWMPIAQESMALSAGVISCNGGLRVCLTADRGCIPDRSRLEDLGKMIDVELLNICEMNNVGITRF